LGCTKIIDLGLPILDFELVVVIFSIGGMETWFSLSSWFGYVNEVVNKVLVPVIGHLFIFFFVLENDHSQNSFFWLENYTSDTGLIAHHLEVH
jgi:hypothetical protein